MTAAGTFGAKTVRICSYDLPVVIWSLITDFDLRITYFSWGFNLLIGLIDFIYAPLRQYGSCLKLCATNRGKAALGKTHTKWSLIDREPETT